MLFTVPQYIDTINDSRGLTRSLGTLDVCRDSDGRPFFIAGNSSVVFKIRHEGRTKMLKCYTRRKPNLRRIYGPRCLHDELYVYRADGRGMWTDVVLDDWLEGCTLRRAVAGCAGDGRALGMLAREFDRFALWLLRQEWAHGDLKPDNIIVDAEGRMHLIDFDAVFLPEFAGERSDETGTAAFQHPARTAELFDKSIDDYPAALISSALHALSADPTLADRFDTDDMLLFDPRDIAAGRCRALGEVLDIFARKCMAVSYRMAELLRSAAPQLPGLRPLLEYAAAEEYAGGEVPELAGSGGRWGYAAEGRFVIPPLYDYGFDFAEGLAAVRLGSRFHFIDTSGRPVIDCGECTAAKPFRNGQAEIVCGGKRLLIDRRGRIIGAGCCESRDK